jgi:hypothetical protein
MISASIGFVGGILFAAAFPGPSAVIRDKVDDAIYWVRKKVGL